MKVVFFDVEDGTCINTQEFNSAADAKLFMEMIEDTDLPLVWDDAEFNISSRTFNVGTGEFHIMLEVIDD